MSIVVARIVTTNTRPLAVLIYFQPLPGQPIKFAGTGEKLSGLMVGQNGKSSTLNGWLPSAALGLKVVDAVGDIRAHPTGDMGSIGMAGSPEQVIQTAVGGNRAEKSHARDLCEPRTRTAAVP